MAGTARSPAGADLHQYPFADAGDHCAGYLDTILPIKLMGIKKAMPKAVQMSLYADIDCRRQLGWFSGALAALKVKENSDKSPDRFGDALRRWNHNKPRSKVTAISLFSGGEDLDIGFHDAGFQLIECNEIEPTFAATLRINSSQGKHLEGIKIVCQDIEQYPHQ